MATLLPEPTITSVEALMMGLLAALFLYVWLSSRERGTLTLALGFTLAALWYFHSDQLPYTGPTIDVPVLRAWSIVIGSAVLVVSAGVVQYLGVPTGWMRALVVGFWLPGLALVLGLAIGLPITHFVFHIGVLAAYAGAALLSFRRAAQQPGDGHLLLGLSLLSLPLTPLLLPVLGVDGRALKYFAGVSLVAFGLILLTVSLLRRQRALGAEVASRAAAEDQLRDANARLEARVDERTAHLRELVAGLEAFNRSVSHDLRGPLGGMSQLARSAADALGRGDRSLAERALPLIATQCDTSHKLVGSMLDLARLPESARQQVRIDLAATVRSAFEEVMLGSGAARRPLLVCSGVAEVAADPDLLHPVLVNVLGNAVKFLRDTPAPRIDVHATLAGDTATITVRDNGPGFAPEAATRLFEPFYRAHGSAYEGSGIGLSIVRRAVETMGGRVWALPLSGGGAEIGFTLAHARTPQALPA